jgi:hypothetical protein
MRAFYKFCLLIFLLTFDFVLFAQPTDDGGGLEDDDPLPTPINTKLIWLALLGIIFVLYTIRKRTVIK